MSARIWERISDLAARPPVVVSQDADLISVSRTLWEHEVGVALVVAHDGRIVGLISERDVIAALALGRRPEYTGVVSIRDLLRPLLVRSLGG
jgi:CBS domain-containing protein